VIQVRDLGTGFAVRTDAGTEHLVTIPDDMLADPVLGADPERLVRESFVFLLEREPATSILGRFSLDVIGRYFPEYPAEIRRKLGSPPA
jgi:hypothetical protein